MNKHKNSILLCFALVFCLLLAGCAEQVELSTGKYNVEETTSFTGIVTKEDLSLMDGLTMLEKADFSGSSCVNEIFLWAQQHPNVDVRYTLQLPTGETVDNAVKSLDLSSLNSEALLGFVDTLKYLPEVNNIELGDASDLDPAANSALTASGNIQVNYTLSMMGEDFSPDTDSFDFSGISSAQLQECLAVLPLFEDVKSIKLTDAQLDWNDFALLAEACPNAAFDYDFELYGKPVNLLDTEMDFSYQILPDNGEALRQALPYFSNLTFVNMDSCGISNEDMAALQAEFPETKLVWRVFFGRTYTLRTDAEKCLASKPSVGGDLTDADLEVLKYCTDLKYVDIGHNLELSSLEFAAHLPKLEVLVIAMNVISDISPLANCPNLEYIELNSTQVSDLSPLANLSNLRHLNIGNCSNVRDISPLYGLTELERLWIGSITPVPANQVEEMKKNAPNCEINTTTYDPTGGAWRVTGYTELSLALYAETGWLQEVLHPRYELLREQFGYAEQAYSFYFKDPTYLGPAL